MASVPHVPADRQPGRPAASGPARVVAARPVLWFFVLAYALTWAWWLPLALAGQTVTQGAGWPTHFPGLLGPALAAVLVTAATHGPSGLGDLLRRMGRWRIGLGGWLLAVSPLALGVVAVLVVGLAGKGWPEPAELGRYSGLPTLGIVTVWLLVVVGNGWGEETGWRGYAQEQLQRRHSPLAATPVVALLWAAWHAPMFGVLDSYKSLGVAALTGFFLGLTCGAVVLTWVYNTCRHSILAAAVWHGCYNLAAATQTSRGTVATVVTTSIMVWAIVLVVLEVRASRRGASVLKVQDNPGRRRQ
jgi:membrane protease YdiL (CAAX protease family)